MKTIQKNLEVIAINIDFILNRLHIILKEEQKIYYLQLLKQQHSNLENNLSKLNNMSSVIELLKDLMHIIQTGKSIVNFILLENIIKIQKLQKPKAKSQKPKAKSQKPKAIKL